MKKIVEFFARFIKFLHGMFSSVRPSPQKSGGGEFSQQLIERPVTFDRFGRPVKWLPVVQTPKKNRYVLTWSVQLKEKFRFWRLGYYCKFREYENKRTGEIELHRTLERL